MATYEAMLRSMEAITAREGDEWAAVDRTEYEVDEEDLAAWRKPGGEDE